MTNTPYIGDLNPVVRRAVLAGHGWAQKQTLTTLALTGACVGVVTGVCIAVTYSLWYGSTLDPMSETD